MAVDSDAVSLQRYGRLAGFMYVFSMAVFIAAFAITSSFAVKGDFAATAQRIAQSELLYRFALTCLLIGSMTIFAIGWAFYCLLRPVAPNLALFALLWRAAEAALVGVGAVIRFTALDNYLHASDNGVRALLGPLILGGYDASYLVGQAYLATGSIIFFCLMFRFRIIPVAFAGFCVAASGLLLLQTLASLLAPPWGARLDLPGNVCMFIAEVGTGLWLLIKGPDLRRLQ